MTALVPKTMSLYQIVLTQKNHCTHNIVIGSQIHCFYNEGTLMSSFLIEESTAVVFQIAYLCCAEGLHKGRQVWVYVAWVKECAQLTKSIMQVPSITLNHMQHAARIGIWLLQKSIALDVAADGWLPISSLKPIQDVQLCGLAATATAASCSDWGSMDLLHEALHM